MLGITSWLDGSTVDDCYRSILTDRLDAFCGLLNRLVRGLSH